MKLVHIVASALLAISGCAIPRVSGNYTFDNVKVNYAVRVEDNEDSALVSALEELERVPDSVQRIGNNYGRVVLFDGFITEEPEFAHLQGKKHSTGGLWDNIPGAFHAQTRSAFISIYMRGRGKSVGLHEYGHLIDAAMGGISSQQSFLEIYSYYKARWFGFLLSEHAHSDPREFFAECFVNYYHSDYARNNLEGSFPKAFEFFEQLDARIARMD